MQIVRIYCHHYYVINFASPSFDRVGRNQFSGEQRVAAVEVKSGFIFICRSAAIGRRATSDRSSITYFHIIGSLILLFLLLSIYSRLIGSPEGAMYRRT
jgi:hypothetical protein